MPRIVPEFPATRDTFLVSLLTGRHTDDHGILANQMFFEATQNVTNLTQPLPWEHVKSLKTIWVNYLIQVLCLLLFWFCEKWTKYHFIYFKYIFHPPYTHLFSFKKSTLDTIFSTLLIGRRLPSFLFIRDLKVFTNRVEKSSSIDSSLLLVRTIAALLWVFPLKIPHFT